MRDLTIGFAITGSFCTFKAVFPQMNLLVEHGYRVLPIMSENAYATDTRFGRAADWAAQAEEICGEKVIHTIAQAEPIGPKKLLDLLILAPCTGNTLGKLACGIYDTAPTLAVKSHRRNGRPVLIAVSTNDALAGAAAARLCAGLPKGMRAALWLPIAAGMMRIAAGRAELRQQLPDHRPAPHHGRRRTVAGAAAGVGGARRRCDVDTAPQPDQRIRCGALHDADSRYGRGFLRKESGFGRESSASRCP